MVGFHHLMQIGWLINVLIEHSELLCHKVLTLGIRGLLKHIFDACTADILDLNRLQSILSNTPVGGNALCTVCTEEFYGLRKKDACKVKRLWYCFAVMQTSD
jgi:hypothetical protein